MNNFFYLLKMIILANNPEPPKRNTLKHCSYNLCAVRSTLSCFSFFFNVLMPSFFCSRTVQANVYFLCFVIIYLFHLHLFSSRFWWKFCKHFSRTALLMLMGVIISLRPLWTFYFFLFLRSPWTFCFFLFSLPALSWPAPVSSVHPPEHEMINDKLRHTNIWLSLEYHDTVKTHPMNHLLSYFHLHFLSLLLF